MMLQNLHDKMHLLDSWLDWIWRWKHHVVREVGIVVSTLNYSWEKWKIIYYESQKPNASSSSILWECRNETYTSQETHQHRKCYTVYNYLNWNSYKTCLVQTCVSEYVITNITSNCEYSWNSSQQTKIWPQFITSVYNKMCVTIVRHASYFVSFLADTSESKN
jgi:hypothetical protein